MKKLSNLFKASFLRHLKPSSLQLKLWTYQLQCHFFHPPHSNLPQLNTNSPPPESQPLKSSDLLNKRTLKPRLKVIPLQTATQCHFVICTFCWVPTGPFCPSGSEGSLNSPSFSILSQCRSGQLQSLGRARETTVTPCWYVLDGICTTFRKSQSSPRILEKNSYHPFEKSTISLANACTETLVNNSPFKSCLACYAGSWLPSPAVECIMQPLIVNPERSPRPKGNGLATCKLRVHRNAGITCARRTGGISEIKQKQEV